MDHFFRNSWNTFCDYFYERSAPNKHTDLPNEVWHLIFLNLNLYEIKQLSLVDRGMNLILSAKLFWTAYYSTYHIKILGKNLNFTKTQEWLHEIDYINIIEKYVDCVENGRSCKFLHFNNENVGRIGGGHLRINLNYVKMENIDVLQITSNTTNRTNGRIIDLLSEDQLKDVRPHSILTITFLTLFISDYRGTVLYSKCPISIDEKLIILYQIFKNIKH